MSGALLGSVWSLTGVSFSSGSRQASHRDSSARIRVRNPSLWLFHRHVRVYGRVYVPVSALKPCSRPALGAKRSQLMGERQELGLHKGILGVLLVPAPSCQPLAVSAFRYQTCSWLLPSGAGTRPQWLTLPPFFAGVCPHCHKRDVGDAKRGTGCEKQSGPSCGDNNLCQTEL